MMPRGSSSAAYRPHVPPPTSQLSKMPTLDRLLKYTKTTGGESHRFFQASNSGRIERMPATPSRPQQAPSWQIPDSQATSANFSQMIIGSSQNSSSQQDYSSSQPASSQTPKFSGGHSQPPLPPKASETAARIEDRIFQTQRSQMLDTFNRLVTELQDVKSQLASHQSDSADPSPMAGLETQVKDILKPDLQRLEQSIIMASSTCPSAESLTRELSKLRAEIQEARAEAMKSTKGMSELQAAFIDLRGQFLKLQDRQSRVAVSVPAPRSPVPVSVGPIVNSKASCKPSASAINQQSSDGPTSGAAPRDDDDEEPESPDMLAEESPLREDVVIGRSTSSTQAQQRRALRRQDSDADGSQSAGWTMGVDEYLKHYRNVSAMAASRDPCASSASRGPQQPPVQSYTDRSRRDPSPPLPAKTTKPKAKDSHPHVTAATPRTGATFTNQYTSRERPGRAAERQQHTEEDESRRVNSTPSSRRGRSTRQNSSIFDFEGSPDTRIKVDSGWSSNKRRRK